MLFGMSLVMACIDCRRGAVVAPRVRVRLEAAHGRSSRGVESLYDRVHLSVSLHDGQDGIGLDVECD